MLYFKHDHIVFVIPFIFGLLRLEPTYCASQSFAQCCDLGKNYANTDVSCATIKPPFDGVDDKLQANCLTTSVSCCNGQVKENDCRMGLNDAANGSCSAPTSSERQECCNACSLGKRKATTGSCNADANMNSRYAKHFTSCCEKLLPQNATTEKRLNDEQLGNLCELEDLCAQICIPMGDSYRCDCNPGYTLLPDGNSCKKVQVKSAAAKKSDRCAANNPCAHVCHDTGVAIYCTCEDGYELGEDKTSCKDIDECAIGNHECYPGETCVNGDGYYDCISGDDDKDYDINCSRGYRYSWDTQKCEDIDECMLPLTCLPSQKCTNTEGSFECTGGEPVCPSGYQYKANIEDCVDVDECVTGQNDCNRESQVCLNNKGSYTCVDKAAKKVCPPGYMMNPGLQICVDIDECAQEVPLCGADELCVNEVGGHTCTPMARPPKPVQTTLTTITTTSKSTTTPPQTTAATVKTSSTTFTTLTTKTTPKATTTKPTTTRITPRSTTTIPTTKPTIRKTTSTTERPLRPLHPKTPPTTCNRGYRFSESSQQCEDIDECQNSNLCDNHQQCYNTLGSYICNCNLGYRKDPMVGACVDVNECQVGLFDCADGYRCDNTQGSYLCSRIAGCGTGYTLNYESGVCEDDDECALGVHSCDKLGKNLVCRNTLGSYRCEPQVPLRRPPVPRPPANLYPNYTIVSSQSKHCLPGYYMDAAGACRDVDECQSSPCLRSQKCINLNGRYECVSALVCTSGFELNPMGDACVDVNECNRGTHKCHPTEICRNYNGYYRCECPPGHVKRNQQCTDIDECTLSRGHACMWHSSVCVNTVGSYTCECKDGFEKSGDERCVDVDECRTPEQCEHKCQNTMGGFKCYCASGHTLNADNRTCSDIDECKLFANGVKCAGTCHNTPGSYRCGCPDGYRLGTDGRSCYDIDECETSRGNLCPDPDTICFNTRGAYECASIACPPKYVRDRNQKSRCKPDTESCRYFGSCDRPEFDQITFHFFSIMSNVPIYDGPMNFFKMVGPANPFTRVTFKYDVKNVRVPTGIRPAGRAHFRLDTEQNVALLSILQSIEGPQVIEITLHMQIFNQNSLTNNIVAKLTMFVSQYSI